MPQLSTTLSGFFNHFSFLIRSTECAFDTMSFSVFICEAKIIRYSVPVLATNCMSGSSQWFALIEKYDKISLPRITKRKQYQEQDLFQNKETLSVKKETDLNPSIKIYPFSKVIRFRMNENGHLITRYKTDHVSKGLRFFFYSFRPLAWKTII